MRMQRMNSISRIVIPLMTLLVLAACGILPAAVVPSPTQIPTETQVSPPVNLAPVSSVEIQILESSPVQVVAVTRGDLPDSCTTIGRITQSRENQTFTVAIFTNRPADAVCAQALVPFEEPVSLDVLGLPAGNYTVNVNGVTTSFTLDVPNVPPQGVGSISGVVWHDECAVSGGEGGAPITPTGGCIQGAAGSYRANGILEANEKGIPGVLVNLGSGSCPSTGLSQTTTGPNGTFAFADLPPATYCVSSDPMEGGNSNILLPGEWTYPAQAVGQQVASASSSVVAGEDRGNVNFGWDYQFLPVPPTLPAPTPTLIPSTPTPIPTPCNRIKFIKDVTIPDGTDFAPDTKFTKTWRLQNDGTCTWNTDYDLVFVNGNSMSGPTVQALSGEVQPGEQVDVSVNLISPSNPGGYRGNWQLRSGSGVIFGAGPNATQSFWVDIDVTQASRKEFYNFALNYCSAYWESAVGVLPCPGSPGTSSGSVLLVTDPSLESRKENEPTLLVQPNQAEDGWIQGTYPALEIKTGDHFYAWVGCMANSSGCNVTFQLNYLNQNGVEKPVASWREKFDGEVTVIDWDLSSLSGKKVNFILRMVVKKNPAAANGFWFVPRIDRLDSNM
jgi:Ig-like domain from next to BRCA1 gene/SdrD B-like domain